MNGHISKGNWFQQKLCVGITSSEDEELTETAAKADGVSKSCPMLFPTVSSTLGMDKQDTGPLPCVMLFI